MFDNSTIYWEYVASIVGTANIARVAKLCRFTSNAACVVTQSAVAFGLRVYSNGSIVTVDPTPAGASREVLAPIFAGMVADALNGCPTLWSAAKIRDAGNEVYVYHFSYHPVRSLAIHPLCVCVHVWRPAKDM